MTARPALLALALLALAAGRAAAEDGSWKTAGDTGWQFLAPEDLPQAGTGRFGELFRWGRDWDAGAAQLKRRGGGLRQRQSEWLTVSLENPKRPPPCAPQEPREGKRNGLRTFAYLCPPLGEGVPERHFELDLDSQRALHVVYKHAWDPAFDPHGGLSTAPTAPKQKAPHLRDFQKLISSLRPIPAVGKVLAAAAPGATPPASRAQASSAGLDDPAARAVQEAEEARRAIDQGQSQRALELLGKSLADRPTPQAYALRSWLLHGLGRDAEARADAQAGLALAPADPELRAALEQAQPQTAVLLREAPASAGPITAAAPVAAPSLARAAEAAPPLPEPAASSGSGTLLVIVVGALLLVVGAALAVGVGLGAFLGRRKASAAASVPPAADGATRPVLLRPASLTRYELGRQIGAGGMGVVYEGRDITLGRRVAIKQMRPELKDSESDRARFLSEAKIVARLSHPYIVAFHEVVEERGELFLVFDYVDGVPLSNLLRSGRLPLPQTQRIFSQVCEAISSAHRAHVLHRDLKPANIMIGRDGYAKVMDFGIARQAKETITRLTLADEAGTPAYMAPEQHLGHCAKTSDIYALGVCLYETLTGQLPFRGPDFLAQKERMQYPPPQYLAPDLPKVAELLFQITLAYDPAKRVADAEELIDSIKQLG